MTCHRALRKSAVLTLIFLCFPVFCFSQGYPQRIISLGPYITEEIFLLGAGDRLVADTVYCRFPPEAARKEKIGTVTEVNIEKIVSLKPDLILATPLTDPRAKEKLKNLGIRVVDFPMARNFEEICRYFIELGKLVGNEKEAEGIVMSAKARVDSVRAKVSGLPTPRVFIQVGTKPLFTMTKDSFVNDFIGLAGGINIASDARTGFYSREKVLEQNPDVIIIMNIVGMEEKKIWQRYGTLNAVRNNRIYIIDDYKLGSPTPLSFAGTLEEIAGMLHPGHRPLIRNK